MMNVKILMLQYVLSILCRRKTIFISEHMFYGFLYCTVRRIKMPLKYILNELVNYLLLLILTISEFLLMNGYNYIVKTYDLIDHYRNTILILF